MTPSVHPDEPVVADLRTFAGIHPDKLAFVEDRPGLPVASLTYAEANARVNRLANVMLGLGAVPGETKVAWCGMNSIGVVTMIAAGRKLGITSVPLNYRLSDDEAAYVVDHCDATIVYCDAELAPLFARIRPRTPKVQAVLVFGGPAQGFLDADALVAAAADTEPELPATVAAGTSMIYTSGTTGKPKGTVRTGLALTPQSLALQKLIGYRADDVYIPTGPLYHSGPSAFMAIASRLGNTTIIQRTFDPEDWLRLVDRYRVTSTFSAPTPIRMVCNLPAEVKARYDVSSMKRLIANAAPWSMALKRMYLADFPADSLFEIYGSTELGVNCVLEPADQLRKPGSCGRPAPLVEVRLYDDDGTQVTGTGPEHPGELYVRAQSVFSDYYKQRDSYEADHRDGFQTVGDIAYLDDEGYVYICDRKRDMIISGGMNIYPAEIEAVLENHPAIVEVAVFGIPDEQWGEAVHAVVVRRGGADASHELTAQDVIAFAREHLAGYKVPRSIEWSDELPKNGSGKVLKRELREPFWAGRASRVV